MEITDSQALLDGFESLSLGELTLRLCRYYPERWQSALAAAHGVHIPQSMARAVPKRLAEYVAGRVLAHKLLRAQGCSESVGRCEASRVPRWPRGFVGAITHSHGLAASVVMGADHAAGVGIDIEHWVATETVDQVEGQIWLPSEAQLFLSQGWTKIEAFTTVFSAKESLFKALYPQCKTFFGFQDARVTALNETASQMELTLMSALTADYDVGCALNVHYHKDRGWVATGLLVPQRVPNDKAE